jgi:hypothetical protein
MKTTSATPHFTLRCIVIVYLLLFIAGLVSSGSLLYLVTSVKPIILIGLLKYLLLCVLFTVLVINTIKAFSLKDTAIYRVAVSTKNFKWLFCIAIVISVAAKAGLFNLALKQPVMISWVQIALLSGLAIFCFWADTILQKQMSLADEDSTGEDTTANSGT